MSRPSVCEPLSKSLNHAFFCSPFSALRKQDGILLLGACLSENLEKVGLHID